MPMTRNNIHHRIYIFVRIDNYLILSGYKLLWVMENRNNTTEFILLGLSQKKEIEILWFLLFLLWYVAILIGNLLVMISIASSQFVKQPCISFWVTSPSQTFVTPPLWPQVDRWLAGSKEDHFLPWLHDTALYHALLWGDWGLHPHRDGLWPLCGHLQTSALHSDHDQTEVRCHNRCLLRWVSFSWPSFYPTVAHVYPLLKLACTDTTRIGLLVIANSGLMGLLTSVVLLVS